MEPHSYLYRYSDPLSGRHVWRRSNETWNGQRPTAFLGLYTADQLEATQAPLIAAMREGVEALEQWEVVAALFDEGINILLDGPDDSDREVAAQKLNAARAKYRDFTKDRTALTNMRDTLAKIEGE